MVKSLVIDADNRNIKSLQSLIDENYINIKIVHVAHHMAEGLQIIKKTKFDLLFIDINMVIENHISIFEEIKENITQIIFFADDDKHALKAFKYAAIDYLIKPIEIINLRAAIEKIRSTQPITKTDNKLRISVNTAKKVVFIQLDKINFIQSDNSYTHLNLDNEHPIMSTKSIGYYEEILLEHHFFRIHNSFLVNLNKIKSYIKGNGGYVELENGKKIEVSTRRKDQLLKKLNFE